MNDERSGFWRLVYPPVNLVFRAIFRIRFVDEHHIPVSSGAVIAGNHISPLDPIVIALAAARRRRMLHFLSGTEFFATRFVGWALRRLDQIPLERGAHDLGALAAAVGAAEEGKLVGLFPEGRINNDTQLLRGRRGAARIAVASGAPLLPVGIWGTQVRWPGAGFTLRRPWRPSVVVVFGEPMPAGTGTGASDILRVTNELMERIEALRRQARDLAGPGGTAR